ncbi:MAG: MFS transporter [Thaumarchaeota archaeon]|nr:MFS transporter [Nitrososphaerota archaeon]
MTGVDSSPAKPGTDGASDGLRLRRAATRFVLMVGIMSLFADFTYEGSRSILGPYLGLFGLGGTAVSIISGVGELVGYGLRPLSGRLADTSKRFWPITIFGYVIQMVAVPLLAFAGNWPIAAWLVIQERMGKAIRNPPRDVMLSHAAKEMGYGWAFGVHEALDQSGALLGPLAIAAVFVSGSVTIGDYRTAFMYLAIPAGIMLSLLALARRTYPHPETLEVSPPDLNPGGLPRIYWVYLSGAVLVGAGMGSWLLLAYHLNATGIVSAPLIPVFYAIAMGVSGGGSLLFGRVFDRIGMTVLVPLTLASAAAIPLVWFGGFGFSLVGIALWGLGTGVQESLIPAAVATMVPRERRTSAYGIFTAGYGISLFFGSVIIGLLYAVNLASVVAFGVIVELAAIPVFLWVARRRPEGRV